MSSRHRRRYILILYISLAFVHNKFDYINLRMSNATARRRGRRKRTAAGHSHRTARTRPARRCARPTDVRDRGGMHLNTVFSNKSALALSPGGGGGVVAMDRTRRGPLSRSWTSPLRLGQAAQEPRDGTARRAYPGEEPQFDQNPGHLISLQIEAPSLYGHKVGSSTELLLA